MLHPDDESHALLNSTSRSIRWHQAFQKHPSTSAFALLDAGFFCLAWFWHKVQRILAQGSTMVIRWRGNANLCNLDSFSWLCDQENWQPQHGTHWALDCDVLRPLTYSKVQEAVSASPRSVCARSPINSRKARSNASSDVCNPFRAIPNKATNMLLRVAFLSSCLNFWGPHYWNDKKCKIRKKSYHFEGQTVILQKGYAHMKLWKCRASGMFATILATLATRLPDSGMARCRKTWRNRDARSCLMLTGIP